MYNVIVYPKTQLTAGRSHTSSTQKSKKLYRYISIHPHQGGNENESMTNTTVILSTETTSNQLSLKESKTFFKSVFQMKEP